MRFVPNPLNAPGDLPVPGFVIARIKRWAFAHPWRGDTPLLDPHGLLDTTAITEPGRPVRVLCSFDYHYHGSGWFKNEQYEQCLHISMSHPLARPGLHVDKIGQMGAPGTAYVGPALETLSDQEARAWGYAFFGPDAPKSWFEPAVGPADPYRAPNVVHLRLYYDQHRQPFIPEGEVYTVLRPWSAKVQGSVGGDVR